MVLNRSRRGLLLVVALSRMAGAIRAAAAAPATSLTKEACS
jgi:hypothetical protein